jgi:hypothetical protein
MTQPPEGAPGQVPPPAPYPPAEQPQPPGQVPPPGAFPPQEQFPPQGPFPPQGQFPPQGPFRPQEQLAPQGQFPPPGPEAYPPAQQPGGYGPPGGYLPPGGYVPPGGPGWGGAAPRRSRAKMWTIIGVVAVLVVGGGVTGGILLLGSGGSTGPDKVVESYLTALSTGDAATALKAGPPPASTTFLTNEVLAAQQAKAKISNIKVGKVEQHENEALVPAAYAFGSKVHDQDFYLRKTTGKWQLEATTVELDLSNVDNVPDPTLFGKPVPDGKVSVFPGPLVFGSRNPDITVTDQSSDGFATSPSDAAFPLLETSLSATGQKKVITAVTAALTACTKVKTTEPATCPQKVFDFEAVPGTATWTITSNIAQELKVRIDSGLKVDVSGEIAWAVTYQARDFENRLSTQHDTDHSYITAQVDLSTSPVKATLSGY